ncbi:MAG: hypothetical protein JST89_16375 [Cyanobacteria bacterium SZAS-4]|nr:hypothetical protein [Cyanobacteria bacterium SZAS-4]
MSDLSVQNIHHFDRTTSKSSATFSLLFGICFAFFCQLPCVAEIDGKLLDPYLQREFNWAMFIDLQEDKPFLNYPGSRLNPITQLRVTCGSFERGMSNQADKTPAKLYEEFWYHDDTPIGLRRYRSLDIQSNQIGAIFLGGRGTNATAAAKVLLRLVIELDLRQLSPSVVVVPRDKYDLIASELGRYSFFPRMAAMSSQQFSIHLRSHPYSKNKDEYYYLQY